METQEHGRIPLHESISLIMRKYLMDVAKVQAGGRKEGTNENVNHENNKSQL